MNTAAPTTGVVIIGASTGGPLALDALLPQFKADFPYPIVVAQHLPQTFVDSFIDRLGHECALAITRAEQDAELQPGTIYVAVGGTTTTIEPGDNGPHFEVRANTTDIETPRISQLMASAADVYKQKTIGVILTGMGSDGLRGMEHIRQAGGKTVAQDKASSAVYGMAREVVDEGLADNIVPLDHIAQTISEDIARG